MSRNHFLPIFLAATLVVQSVIVGWGHSHEHLADPTDGHVGIVGQWHHHHVASGQFHSRDSHPPIPILPADKDDCAVCRHLALAAILTFDLEAAAGGDVAECVQDGEVALLPTIAIGLHRPRSPPQLS